MRISGDYEDNDEKDNDVEDDDKNEDDNYNIAPTDDEYGNDKALILTKRGIL